MLRVNLTVDDYAVSFRCRREAAASVQEQKPETKPTKEAPTSFQQARAAAYRKGLPWCLGELRYNYFLNGNCVFCNQKTESMTVHRIDSHKGFIPENCVTACSICDTLKGQSL